jgi:putative methionine-R-sulfoxide reductase with GAF domain
LLDTPHGFIYLLAPGEAEMERKVGLGIFSEARVMRLKPGEGLSGQVWQAGRPIVVDDYDSWPGRSPQGVGLVQAMVGVPLHTGPKVVGVIALATERGSGRTFDADEVELLMRFAQLGGIAIQNARLFDEANRLLAETKQRNAELAVINSVQRRWRRSSTFGASSVEGDKSRGPQRAGPVHRSARSRHRHAHFPYWLELGQLSTPPRPLSAASPPRDPHDGRCGQRDIDGRRASWALPIRRAASASIYAGVPIGRRGSGRRHRAG